MTPFHAPWKYKKTSDFLIFSGSIGREAWHEMGSGAKISVECVQS